MATTVARNNVIKRLNHTTSGNPKEVKAKLPETRSLLAGVELLQVPLQRQDYQEVSLRLYKQYHDAKTDEDKSSRSAAFICFVPKLIAKEITSWHLSSVKILTSQIPAWWRQLQKFSRLVPCIGATLPRSPHYFLGRDLALALCQSTRYRWGGVVSDHMESGYLSKVEYRAVKEPGQEVDFIIRYYPGTGAKESDARIQTYIRDKRNRRRDGHAQYSLKHGKSPTQTEKRALSIITSEHPRLLPY